MSSCIFSWAEFAFLLALFGIFDVPHTLAVYVGSFSGWVCRILKSKLKCCDSHSLIQSDQDWETELSVCSTKYNSLIAVVQKFNTDSTKPYCFKILLLFIKPFWDVFILLSSLLLFFKWRNCIYSFQNSQYWFFSHPPDGRNVVNPKKK